MAHISLKEKTVPLQTLRPFIAEVVREVLEDPDFGKELTAQAKRRLRVAGRTSRAALRSLAAIRKKYA